MKNIILFITLTTLSIFVQAQKDEKIPDTLKVRKVENDITKWTSARPDGHAPIGVSGDHTHHKGELMFSYKGINKQMNQLQSGGKFGVENAFVYSLKYNISPANMTMGMHMLGAMYGVTDKLTICAMTGFVNKNMDMTINPVIANSLGLDSAFSVKTSGLGDIKLTALYQLKNEYKKALHLNLGFSIPTGSITQQATTPMSGGNEIRLGYPMQIGSGSIDPIIGATYLVQKANWSYGLQSMNTLRLFENSEGYRQSSIINANGWITRKLSDLISISGRIEHTTKTAIIGEDLNLNTSVSPTNWSYNSERNETLFHFGVNSYFFDGNLKGLRISFELGFPVHQYVQGVQLANSGVLAGGLQYSF